MTNEEMERAIEFLVQHQAQFSADMQAMRVEFDQRMTTLENKFGKLTDAAIGVTAMLGQLVKQQTESDEKIKVLTEKQTATDAQLKETDERLNIFINVVERYISERHDGRNSNPSNQ